MKTDITNDFGKLPEHIAWAGWSQVSIPCKMCGYEGHMKEVVKLIYNFIYDGKEYAYTMYHRCPQCGCLIPWPEHVTEAKNDVTIQSTLRFLKTFGKS